MIKLDHVVVMVRSLEASLPWYTQLLDLLGFEWTMDHRKRMEGHQAARQYRLTGTSLPLLQKFIHVVKPTKWRDRLVDGAFGAKFIRGRERVVKVTLDL